MTPSLQLVEPAYREFPEWHVTFGPEVADLATSVGLEPDPEQRIALDAIFGVDRRGRSVAFEFATIVARQNMKALATSTPILTARGWVTMIDLLVGDRVFHPAGHMVTVTHVSDVKLGHRCYQVTTTDGRAVVADAGHLWTVFDRRLGHRGDWRTVTTAEIAATGVERSAAGRRTVVTDGVTYQTSELRYQLPVQEPLKSSDVELPIDPYLFGAWLGDGKSNGASLSSHADDVGHWTAVIKGCGFIPTVHIERTCSTVGITTAAGVGRQGRSFGGSLRRLGVLGNKHVPDAYWAAGPSQREALLQGLMDTDGTIHARSGQATFTTTRRALADAVVYLVRSLGWRASAKEGRAILDGRDCGPKFCVTFTPKSSDPFAPFRLPRKADRVQSVDGGKGRFTVSIKSVEQVPTVPVCCIKVESPDGLFLAGRDLVATHNTALFKMCALGWLAITDQELIVWSAHEMDTTREAFRDLTNLIGDYPPLRNRLAGGRSNGIKSGNNNMSIEFRPSQACRYGQRIKFKARTHSGGRGLTGDRVVLDEAFALQNSHMGSLMPTLSARLDPQLLYGSSACRPDSAVLRKIVDRGRSPDSSARKRLAYLEFCAPENSCEDNTCPHATGHPGCAMDRREYIVMANPAAGRRITWEYLEGERDSLDPSEFGRERLGWHDKPAIEGGPLISKDMWANLVDTASAPGPRVAFGVYVNKLQTNAAIAVAGLRSDGKVHVGIVPATRGGRLAATAGIEWIPGRMRELKDSWKPCAWALDDRSAAGSLLPAIAELGIEIENATTADVARACQTFYAKVKGDGLRHQGSKPLADSVTAGKMRDLGDSWVWESRDNRIDIVQLKAVTLAVHGLETAPPPTEVWSFYS